MTRRDEILLRLHRTTAAALGTRFARKFRRCDREDAHAAVTGAVVAAYDRYADLPDDDLVAVLKRVAWNEYKSLCAARIRALDGRRAGAPVHLSSEYDRAAPERCSVDATDLVTGSGLTTRESAAIADLLAGRTAAESAARQRVPRFTVEHRIRTARKKMQKILNSNSENKGRESWE
jgi:DNA-directed RNA polymerase specialized sigma24 family protein